MGAETFRRRRAAEAFEADLRAEIEAGGLAPGDLILSISEICSRYQLKSGAVQKAVRRLEQAGYVEARQGSGMFVSDKFRKAPLRVYVGASSPMRGFLEPQVLAYPGGARLVEQSGEADIVCGTGIGVHARAARGEVMAVESRVRTDPPLAEADWLPGAWERYQSGERTLAVPLYVSPVVLFYNRALFASAGVRPPTSRWKWADLLDAVERLRRVCDTDEAGVLPFMDQFTYYVPFLAQNGTGVFSEAGECLLAGERAVETIDYLRRLHKASGGRVRTDRTGCMDDFLAGRSAMLIWSAHTVARLTERQPFRWGWAPLPGQRRRATLFFSEGLSLSTACADPDAAWAFIKQCVADPAQRYFVERTFPFGARRACATEFIRRHGGSYRMLLREIGNATTEHYRFPQAFGVLNRETDGFLDSSKSNRAIREQCALASRVIGGFVGAQGVQLEQLIA
ncbi:MAG: extracellular solute-binding protein [Kiritimatiellae bacterium]|nr:extracellular solute-binding protein [Kiritimatiellia bacterium]